LIALEKADVKFGGRSVASILMDWTRFLIGRLGKKKGKKLKSILKLRKKEKTGCIRKSEEELLEEK